MCEQSIFLHDNNIKSAIQSLVHQFLPDAKLKMCWGTGGDGYIWGEIENVWKKKRHKDWDKKALTSESVKEKPLSINPQPSPGQLIGTPHLLCTDWPLNVSVD